MPCVLWGKGVERTGPIEEPRSIMDIAPTIAYYLGAQPPAQSVGQVLGVPEDSDASKPMAVIVPAYNEADNLPETLRQMPRAQVADMRVIVVDDGSTDGTAEAARLGGADVVVRHERNRGLGAALRTGLETARDMDARAAVYIDADGEYPPSQIPDLLAPIEAGDADYVLGSRYLGSRRGQAFTRLIANYMFTALLCVASGRVITDGQTGFPRLFPPCPRKGRDHPRLQLRAGDDSRPAQEGYAHARSADLVPAPHEGQLLHRAILLVARAPRDAEGDACPMTENRIDHACISADSLERSSRRISR